MILLRKNYRIIAKLFRYANKLLLHYLHKKLKRLPAETFISYLEAYTTSTRTKMADCKVDAWEYK